MAQTPPPLIEKIEVERVIIDARVTNGVAFHDYGYENAVLALQRARVTVFSIDMMDAHELAYSLASLAGDTGGFYTTSTRFPVIAIHRLHHTLGGHYEIEFVLSVYICVICGSKLVT